MSGMLGQILGGLLGGGQQGQQSPLVGILEQVLATKDNNGNTGVAAILSRFQAAGAGQQAQSWVGTGSNQPVSTDQVSEAFGQDQIEAWANQAGTTPDAMRQVLSEAVPHMVDHLTPEGQVPTPSANLTGLLQGLLGNLGGTRQA